MKQPVIIGIEINRLYVYLCVTHETILRMLLNMSTFGLCSYIYMSVHTYVCRWRLETSCDALLDACETIDWDFIELIEVRETFIVFFLSRDAKVHLRVMSQMCVRRKHNDIQSSPKIQVRDAYKLSMIKL